MGVCNSNNKKKEKRKSIIDDMRNLEITIDSISNYYYIQNMSDNHLISDKSSGINKTVIRWVEFLKNYEEELKSNKISEKSTKIKTPTSSTSESVLDYVQQFGDKIVDVIIRIFKTDKEKLHNNIIQGVPNNIRWLIWRGIIKANSDKNDDDSSEEISYEVLIKMELNSKLKEQIDKDLHRTAPHIQFFQKEAGLNSLFNVLKALALYDEQVSYCQGVNILAANVLILFDGNEKESFEVLKYFFSNLKLREFYIRGFPRLHSYIFILKRLIKMYLSEINEIIEVSLIPDEVWIFKWLQSLYSLTLDFSIGIRLWDCIISSGLEFLFNFTLGFLKFFEKKIITVSDMSEFIEVFKINTKEMKVQEINTLREKFIQLSFSFKFDQNLLDEIISDYKQNFENEYYEEGSFYTNRDKDIDKSYHTITPNPENKFKGGYNDTPRNNINTPNEILKNKNFFDYRLNEESYNFSKRYFIEGEKKLIQFNQPINSIKKIKEPNINEYMHK
jgi:hypothetical protein